MAVCSTMYNTSNFFLKVFGHVRFFIGHSRPPSHHFPTQNKISKEITEELSSDHIKVSLGNNETKKINERISNNSKTCTHTPPNKECCKK